MLKEFSHTNSIINQKTKTSSTSKFIFILLFVNLFLVFTSNGFSQTKGWNSTLEPQKVFIENKGQFSSTTSADPILFAYYGWSTTIYFTKKGISYNFLKRWPKDDDKGEAGEKVTNIEKWKEKEAKEHLMKFKTDDVFMNWENANSDVEIVASEMTSDYHSFCVKDKDGSVKNINFVKAFKKLVYKNIYPGIDIEYVFHPTDGIKYTLILHPGADISQVKMNYSKIPKIMENGDIHIATEFGDIIDHAPTTYYSENKEEAIKSNFIANGNKISFKLDTYNKSKSTIIDPWTQMPSMPNSNGVWECEHDAAGNVYMIGGDMPMMLLKYNAAGAIQYTYYTPWDTANYWLGTFATDLLGNSYVTAGSIAEMQKIDANGSLVWNFTSGLGSVNEYWNIAFNCDQTKLIIGGTTGNMLSLQGAIFDINTSNGSINSTKIVGSGNMFGIPPSIQEVRSISSCRNSRYYFMTLDTLGAIDDDFSVCPTAPPSVFRMNDTYHLSYKCENYRPNNGNAGIMAVRANPNYVYTQNGTTIDRRSLVDGTIINSATIPGGISTASLGQHQVGNSGIDIDSCGNVYVGSGNAIVKYDANLNLITSIATPYAVSDVSVSTGGNVIFCGTTGTSASTSRTGYIQSANMSSCQPMTLVCCDASVCPIGPFCSTDPPATLVAGTPGGTWSGPGVNSATGTFDPSLAGVGAHIVTYTVSCGSNSILINVISCANLSVCQEQNGQLSVWGGNAPYSWQYQHDTTDCSACVIGCTFPPGCAVTVTTWPTYATGATAAFPGTYPIRVVDTYGVVFMVTDTASLPDCAGCPHFTFNPSNIVNVCPGQSTGSFTVTPTGGVSPYILNLKNTGGTSIAAYANVNGSQSFTGLAAGAYNLVAADSNGCMDSTIVTITQTTEMVITLTPQNEGCQGSCDGAITTSVTGGNGPYSFVWSNGQTSQDLTGLCPGNYSVTVTDANTCTKSNSSSLTYNTAINAGFSANPQTGGPPLNVSFTYNGTGATIWNWNFGDGSTSTISNPSHIFDSIGTYTVTLIVSSGTPDFCLDTAKMTIIVQKPSLIIIPNVFTPNGDGSNDEFIIQYREIKSFKCTVFNRWGKKIYEWTDVSKGWDGKTNSGGLAADGVYYYIISATGTDNVEYNLNGSITIIR
ncbi:MAG: gliding motility-associated C-terminal domain-containing protein [Bacteroidota bacterium]